MRDATYQTRIERNLAHLDVLLVTLSKLVGRLEEKLSADPSQTALPTQTQEPPSDDGQKEADEYLERRKEELDEERLELTDA